MKNKIKEDDYSSFQSEWGQVKVKTKNRLRPYFYFYHFKGNVSKVAFMGLMIAFQWSSLGQNLDLLRFRVLDSIHMINLFFTQLIRISWTFIAY